MSVPVYKRGESSVQYVDTAFQIADKAKEFAGKIAKDKYPIWGKDIVRLASQLRDDVCKANKTGRQSETRARLREEYLLKAGADLEALDGAMSACLKAIACHPERSIVKARTGEPLQPTEALKKVSKACLALGELMLSEREQIRKVYGENHKVIKKFAERRQNSCASV